MGSIPIEGSYELHTENMDKITYMGLVIHSTDQFDWVDANEIPEQFRPMFYSWMKGQTGPMIEGYNAVYRHDFERWYEMKFLNKPTYFD